MPCGGRGTLIQNEQAPSLCLRGVGGAATEGTALELSSTCDAEFTVWPASGGAFELRMGPLEYCAGPPDGVTPTSGELLGLRAGPGAPLEGLLHACHRDPLRWKADEKRHVELHGDSLSK